MHFSGCEFRLFVEEYLACAADAKTDERRQYWLGMADMWNGVAVRQEREDSRCPDRWKRIDVPTRR